MGTRGYIVIKYKSKYYTIYNHFDSYPEYLGEFLVMLIKTMDIYKLGPKLENIENYEDVTMYTTLTDEFCFQHAILSKLLPSLWKEKEIIVSDKCPERDVFIEWIYLIDLDEKTFATIGGAKVEHLEYPLNNIPNDWSKPLQD